MDARLKVNGQEVPIGQSRINLKKTNPLFVRDGLPSIRSLPFQLPALDEIRKIFGFPENVHNLAVVNTLPAELYIQDSIHIKGKLDVLEASHRMLECRLLDGLGEFARDFGDTSIRDLALGSVDYRAALATTTIEFINDSEFVDYNIGLNGEDYQYIVQSGDTLADIAGAFRDMINTDFPGYASIGGTGNAFLTVAQPTVDDAYEFSWDRALGITFWDITNVYSVADARADDYKAWFEDVNKTNPANYDYCMPAMWAPHYFYDKNNPGMLAFHEGRINWWYNGEAQVNSPTGDETDSWTNTCLPCMKLKPLILELFAHAGYTLEIDSDFESSRDFEIAYMNNMYAIDEVVRIWKETGPSGWEHVNIFQGKFDLNKMVPDIDFTTFLRGVAITFMAQFEWVEDEKRVVLRAADKVFETSEEQDWEPLVVGRPHLKYFYNKGYTLSHAQESNDLVYTQDDAAAYLALVPDYPHQVSPYIFGEGKEAVENPFGIQVTRWVLNNSVEYYLPTMLVKGFSDYFELGYGTWTPRIGFFRGFTEGTANDYPGGRADDWDNTGAHIADAYSLAWGGTYGLVETRYKNFLQFMATSRPVEIYIDPAKTTMAHLDSDTPKRALGTRWILADYTLDLPARGPQKVTLYRF